MSTVELQDLPGCNISTLGQCWGLKSLKMSNCNLTVVEGLQQCKQLQFLDLQVTHKLIYFSGVVITFHLMRSLHIYTNRGKLSNFARHWLLYVHVNEKICVLFSNYYRKTSFSMLTLRIWVTWPFLTYPTIPWVPFMDYQDVPIYDG